ncbi:MAG: J domain-containing protein [Candidatus Hydrogenedentes bacterium]|jgi:hypothetical protein|nr:J domain-containing protein [Candidatus Hydrogenedentota bacterium]
MRSKEVTQSGLDPWDVLGVPDDVGEEELRQAYLKKLRQYPPDRAPKEFERIRDAYNEARNPGMRVQAMLTAENPGAPLASLLDGVECERAFVGPKPWLALMKEK